MSDYYVSDDRTLEEKLADAEAKLNQKREAYRRYSKDPEVAHHWAHYKNEDDCVAREVISVRWLKERIYYQNLPDIDREIFDIKERINGSKRNIKQKIQEIRQVQGLLKKQKATLEKLEKEKLIIELAGIK